MTSIDLDRLIHEPALKQKALEAEYTQRVTTFVDLIVLHKPKHPELANQFAQLMNKFEQHKRSGFLNPCHLEKSLQTLPSPLKSQLTDEIKKLNLLYQDIEHCKAIIEAAPQYIKDYNNLERLVSQNISHGEYLKTYAAITALLTCAQNTDFSLKHAEAVEDINSYLMPLMSLPRFSFDLREDSDYIDSFPGGARHTATWNHLRENGELYLLLLPILPILLPAILCLPISWVMIIAPIILWAVILTPFLVGAIFLHSNATRQRTGMAHAMSEVASAIQLDKMNQIFDNSIKELLPHKTDASIGSSVTALIEAFFIAKEDRMNANQSIYELNALLGKINGLIANGTEDKIHEFLNSDNNILVFVKKRWTTLFRPYDESQLEQAVNKFCDELLTSLIPSINQDKETKQLEDLTEKYSLL